MITPWIGTKKILVIPTIVTGSLLYEPAPADWVEQIKRRLYYDPHPQTGLDRSLRKYIHTISYGKSLLIADVSDPISVPVAADGSCRTSAAIQAHPYSHLYEFVKVIFTNGNHGCGGMATWGGLFTFNPPRQGNILHGRTRVKMSESMGTWAMELLHMTTGFGDLYFTTPNPGRFDEMSCACGTHPSAYTKISLGYISPTNAPFAALVESKNYYLHAIGLIQPPPPGRVSAIKISAGSPGRYFIIECRLKVDQFETQTDGCSSGIPSEGVIINEVNPDWSSPLQLRTPIALITGQEYVFPSIGMTLKVKDKINGGYKITVLTTGSALCEVKKNKIQDLEALVRNLQEQLHHASPAQKPGILIMIRDTRAEIKNIKAQMVDLGCSTV